jgi:hypothetical protein
VAWSEGARPRAACCQEGAVPRREGLESRTGGRAIRALRGWESWLRPFQAWCESRWAARTCIGPADRMAGSVAVSRCGARITGRTVARPRRRKTLAYSGLGVHKNHRSRSLHARDAFGNTWRILGYLGTPERSEASDGFYQSTWGTSHAKVQILAVEELLLGRQVDMPPSRDLRTFKRAPRVKKGSDTQEQTLSFGADDDE